ncbi:arylamine N-acetyltransferase, partial [Mycobacterium tuberculosis]|nr:arylamine N-acetyltransferase [Mycobacterium tuberculosis]
EQNGLLERALREIGFNVRSLLGRVVLANPPQMPPRTHRLLLVEVAGELGLVGAPVGAVDRDGRRLDVAGACDGGAQREVATSAPHR